MKKLYILFIALIAGSSAFSQTVTSGDMENWRSGNAGTSPVVPIHAPLQWYGIDSLVVAAEEAYLPIFYAGYMPTDLHTQLWQETTIKHGGTSSAKLMTIRQDTFGRIAGILSNAQVNLNIATTSYSYSGGQAIAGRIGSVSAWVQYTAGFDSATHLTGIDSGVLTVIVYAKVLGIDSAVGNATLKIGPSASFQHVTANVLYNDELHGADTIRITFASSGQTGALDSSTLYVDDITMTYAPTLGVLNNINSVTEPIKVYPNPVSGMLYLEGSQSEGSTLQLYSVSGQLVAAKTLNGKDMVDVSYLSEGLYFYTITDKTNTVQRGKVSVVR